MTLLASSGSWNVRVTVRTRMLLVGFQNFSVSFRTICDRLARRSEIWMHALDVKMMEQAFDIQVITSILV